MRLFASLLLLIALQMSAEAAFYQWRDEFGQTHVTDDPTKVPEKHRDGSERKVQPVQVVQRVVPAVAGAPESDGAQIFLQRCAKCHHLGMGQKGGLIGMGPSIINPDTGFPYPKPYVADQVRLAVTGSMEMERIELSQSEIEAVTDYVISEMER